MRTENEELKVKKGCFLFILRVNSRIYHGSKRRTILFRVRYGNSMISRTKDWPTNPTWQATDRDREYFSA